ncbi:sulfotransferase family protein [Marinibactrum halimedae]|uniref:Sulfotransferase n=1 Tax=Marinibactrum halimedae TaxID=1444977 RepID=A0AA37T5E3_9GAMM|nr:sulfotransferase [Marinibactrum halimedae]MCD9458367.1 sulfotransferase [Marinibactrum halimedae]GLS26064.1 hypothetical protein GCM10007877_17790 [Marinibactrum halimedae]
MVDAQNSTVTDCPIFVVGPLRSGTTMLRLMLDHHPDMNIFGEFECAVSEAINNQWPSIEHYHAFLKTDREFADMKLSVDSTLNYEQLVKSFLRQQYLRNPVKKVGASVHSRMDMLPKIWPQAKFIHLLRDPRDVAKSCIGMGWVGNVHEGTQYWIKPERHWEALEKSIPESQRYTVRYEDLVAEPEKELSKICDFIGVPYSDEMLNLEKDTTYSRPDARYANQWKKKLTPKQISHVEYQCHEMMRTRGYDIASDKIEKPSMLEMLKIQMQSRLYRISFNVKRWGFSLWLLFIISKRLGLKSLKDSCQLRINKITVRYLK